MKTAKKQTIEYLKKTGLKAYHLADLARVPRPSLYKWLNYGRDLKLATWEKIRKVIEKHDAKKTP
jgi:predicted transcriptional regulator